MRVSRLVGLLAMLVVVGSASAAGGLPGAHAIKICAAAGAYWPTMTLALSGDSAWLACKEQSRVIRVNTKTGKTTKSLRLGTPVIAVASGFGSVWALDSGSELYRIDPASGRIVKRLYLGASAAYNLWIGGGSVWAADDQGAAVVRVKPSTNRVVARPRVGDGPADVVFNGGSAWVISHRDRALHRIDLNTNRSRKLAVLPGEAPERMAWSHGSLWATGRGTDPAQGGSDRRRRAGHDRDRAEWPTSRRRARICGSRREAPPAIRAASRRWTRSSASRSRGLSRL